MDIAGYIALVIAVVAPMVTTLLSNRHQLKLKKIDLYEKRRLDAIEEYLSKSSAMNMSNSQYSTRVIYDEYNSAFGKVILFLPKQSLDVANKFHQFVIKNQYKDCQDLFPDLCQSISDNLKSDLSN